MSVKTMPDIASETRFHLAIPAGVSVSCGTFLATFDKIKHKLADKPLHRPNRTRPIRILSGDDLKQIAAQNPPPAEWFDGEDERPF